MSIGVFPAPPCLSPFSLNAPGDKLSPFPPSQAPPHLSCPHWPSLRTLLWPLPLLLGVVVGVVVLDDIVLTAEQPNYS